MYFRKCMWMVGAAAALASGCASQKTNTDREADKSIGQLTQDELDEERRDFIAERSEQLEELDTEIERLEVRLKHEGPLHDEEQRAEWSQQLFELKQDHQSAQAELERARGASKEEWAEMRGTLGYSIDTLQATTTKLASDVSGWFESEDNETGAAATASGGGGEASKVDLCNIQVSGTNAEVTQSAGKLIVEMTNPDPEDRDELRERAEKMSKEMTAEPRAERADERDPAAADTQPSETASGGDEAAASQAALVADVEVQDIDGGVRVIFEPAEGKQAALRTALEDEVERIQEQRC